MAGPQSIGACVEGDGQAARDRYIDGLSPQLVRAECKRLMQVNTGLRHERDQAELRAAMQRAAVVTQPYTDMAMCGVAMVIGGGGGFLLGLAVRLALP